ncbi:Cupin domain-containing protein [Humidesulfovibrio mexicanus]|uniref:Cupin domain-containing protein n=1 Tax=Humidesulfovibrio mexicanus TaxID=147047 RepID=A0A238ZBW0_9BACT|nr:cupin domain-containing protein [Humidesulfovibrio mexicanus]SNR80421.1 Cupin domain-containing protein [Humidesulfovibrio mexicanus]
MPNDLSLLPGTMRLAAPGREKDLAALPWNPHASFPGVALKHLLTAADTDGAMSAHLVRVEAGCVLEEHTHPANMELHEVVAGAGTCLLAGDSVRYEPGVCGLMPAGVRHAVRADAGHDLYILAKFVPPLL